MKNYYDYTIVSNYDKTVFEKTVELIMKNIKDIIETEYDEDMYDELQVQYIKTSRGEIRVGNQLINSAVWVMTEIDLDDVLKEWEDKTFYKSESRTLTPEEGQRLLQRVREAGERYREYIEKQKMEDF